MSERDIFDAALALADPAERSAYLEQACAGDAALKAHLEGLLAMHDHLGSFLEAPAPVLGVTVAEPVPEGPGTVIGPYKLLEAIGEGGFGIVYLAEQQEPIRRKVALKILKPGMDSKQVIARFEQERQALALMDHPHIARVFDAGATASGRPYFVMELVKGIPITDYCDQSRLTPRQRLGLFVDVCQAVQHAHQKGIIHRDLKPSNVLVTLHDGSPVVKVIDFGIAKALDQPLTDKTLFTGFAQLVGTPLYMSPEQAALSGLDVDTRSDIYSLGVLLYELLTGTTPFTRERLREVGFDELRRIIREEEPPKPSTRISTLGQAASTVSANRQSEPGCLSKLLRGELDWIVMKALEKERSRRYETASAFAADVERYLNDEPVLACPPSAWYRFCKFARRNRVALTTVALVAAALIVGTALSLWQAVRARQAEDRAEGQLEKTKEESQRAGGNLRLALQALDDLHNDLARSGLVEQPHLEALRRKYLERALAFYQEFGRKNSADPAVALETAKAYSRLASILDVLGSRAEAEKAFHQALARLEELAPDPSAGPHMRREIAECLLSYGILLRKTRRPQQAEKTYHRGLGILADLKTTLAKEIRYRRELAHGYLNLAAALDDMNRYGEAEKAARQGLRLLRELVKEHPKVTDFPSNLSLGLSNLAIILWNSKRLKEAEAALDEAGAIQSRVLALFPGVPQFRWHLSSIQSIHGILLASGGRPVEAEPHLRQAFQLQKRLAADFPATAAYRTKLAETAGWLGGLLMRSGRADQGRALHEQLVKEFPKAPECQDKLAGYLNDLGTQELVAGRAKAAAKLQRRSIAIYEKLVKDHTHEPAYRRGWAAALGNHAFVLARTGRPHEAEQYARQALAAHKDLWSLLGAGPAYEPADRPRGVLDALGVSLHALPRRPDYRGELAVAYANLGRLWLDQKRFQDADHVYREGLETVPDSPALNNAVAWLRATCADARLRDPKHAVKLAQKAVALAPGKATYQGTLGVAQYRAAEHAAAVTALEKAIHLHGAGNPYASAINALFLAMAQWQLGQKEEARKWYGQAVQLMEKSRPQDEELRRFHAEAGELLEIKKR
jgi:serine/threonine protein kinase/tetratricopeptide (TPR) repeat protein